MQVSHAFLACAPSVAEIILVSHHCLAPVGQLAKPMSWQMALVHIPFKQADMFMGQTLAQAPQFLASVPVFTSQPSLTLLLQSAKPGRHLSNTHMFCTHLLIAPGMLQFWQVQ